MHRRDRPEYPLKLPINGRSLNRVIIDQHYREKHGEAMSDELILELVKVLDGREFDVEATQDDHEYCTANYVLLAGRHYRLILVLSPSDDFLGVVNAFRVKGQTCLDFPAKKS